VAAAGLRKAYAKARIFIDSGVSKQKALGDKGFCSCFSFWLRAKIRH